MRREDEKLCAIAAQRGPLAFGFLALVGVLLMFVVGVAALVLIVVGTVKAGSYEHYRYPATIRFVS